MLVAGGLILIAASGAAGLRPIAPVCGVLLVCFGLVRVLVLLLSHPTLRAYSPPDPGPAPLASGSATGV